MKKFTIFLTVVFAVRAHSEVDICLAEVKNEINETIEDSLNECTNHGHGFRDKYVEDCNSDPSFTGVRNIKTKEGRIFTAYCDQGWMYIFKRFDGTEDFYRTWTEYQHGFGYAEKEHFIGLDNLASVLTQGNYKVRIELAMWPGPTSEAKFAEYSIFNIDRSDKYRLIIGGYRGSMNDSMTQHSNGQQFSTYDNDNDLHGTENCAVIFKGAWWYKNCRLANLFSIYAKGPVCPERAACVSWYHWGSDIGHPSNDYYSFKEASMKLYRTI